MTDAPTSDHQVLDRDDLAAMVDHTILRPEATRSQVEQVAIEAVELGCATVCVQPSMVSFVVALVDGRIPVCAVVGFPHGTMPGRLIADAAAAVVALGASEVDMVVDLGAVAEDELGQVADDVALVRAAIPDVMLKVIVESALWTPPTLRGVCEATLEGGADMVKTSTGFHPAGGASVEAVKILREVVGRRAGVKASGGIRTAEDARAMINAGADRLGLSGTAKVLADW